MSKSFDSQVDTVYLTEALERRYPCVYKPMKLNLEANGIKVHTVKDTNNIWIRDYFPVQINGEFFLFDYTYGHEKWIKKYPQLDVSNKPWSGVIAPIRISHLVIDGGNIVQGFGKVILTQKVIEDNGPEVVGILEKLFKAEIIIIPSEPGDSLGHSDGICNFLDCDTVLINDYSSVAKKDKAFAHYEERLIKTFGKHKLKTEKFPFAYAEWDWEMSLRKFRAEFPGADDFNPAFGYYMNFLMVKGLILFPAMRIKHDIEAMNAVKQFYPGFNIIAIDCSKLSYEGGLLHCVSSSARTASDSHRPGLAEGDYIYNRRHPLREGKRKE